jgi:hypothetical protein
MLLRRPFVTPSLINDSPAARAKVRREFKQIVLEAAGYLGVSEVKRIVHDTTVGRQGNTPDEKRNARILVEWDAAGLVTQKAFARNFCQKYHRETVGAVVRQLRRLLKARQQQAEEEARRAERDRRLRAAAQRKSLLGGQD